jgi:hypothetical protein
LPSSSSSSAAEAALSPASDRGVAARELNADEETELGASNDGPAPADGPRLKRLVGGGFEGVVEADGAWNWKVGADFFSVAAPNLIGVVCLKVWSPPKVSDLGGAVFEPAAPKSKKCNGLVAGVEEPFAPKIGVEFSFSDSEPSSSERDMRESRFPFDVVVGFWRLAFSSESETSIDFRFGGVVPSSSSDSSWLFDEAPDETWPKMLLDGVCAVLGASNTEPVLDRAGLAGRELNSPGVDAPLDGLGRLAKGFAGVGAEGADADAGAAAGLGVKPVKGGKESADAVLDASAGLGAASGLAAAGVAPNAGRENPDDAATAAFSLARRSASLLSYRADHSSLVSSSES